MVGGKGFEPSSARLPAEDSVVELTADGREDRTRTGACQLPKLVSNPLLHLPRDGWDGGTRTHACRPPEPVSNPLLYVPIGVTDGYRTR